jgi:hypothetical protein
MQQQQGSRDRVAQQQQMAGSSDFQPPRQQGAGQRGQRGTAKDAGTPEGTERMRRSDDQTREMKQD